MKGTTLSFRKILSIYRITDWLYFIGFSLFGYFFSLHNIRLLQLIFLSAFILSFAYSLNEYYDKNKGKFKFFPYFPLFLSFFFLSGLTLTQILSYLFFIIIFYFYSAPPRLKGVPFLGSFLNGIGFSLLFLLGYGRLDLFACFFSLLLFSLEMPAQLIHEVVDYEEDKRDKINTTTIYLGKGGSKSLCYVFLLASVITSFLISLALEVHSTLLFVPFSLYFLDEIKETNLKQKLFQKLRRRYKILGTSTGSLFLLLNILKIIR